MLALPPDLALKGGRPAYSPRQAAAVLSVSAVTVKRYFEAGELSGEKLPSRGKKEYYAIYAESLEAFASLRATKAPALHPAPVDDTLSLLHAAQASSRIQELESQLARHEERLAHLQHLLAESTARELKLREVIKQQSSQLQSFVVAQSSILEHIT